MISKYKMQSNLGIVLWAAFKFAAIISLVFAEPKEPGTEAATPIAFIVLFGLGTISLMWGAWAQAKGKGYPAAMFLLGVLELPGLIVLALLPDKVR